jgi:hypothetical protein
MFCPVTLSVTAMGLAQQATPSNVAAKIEQIMKEKWTCWNLQVRV